MAAGKQQINSQRLDTNELEGKRDKFTRKD
jgi:hypothetical protein